MVGGSHRTALCDTRGVTIYLITGDDESLVLEELGTRVHELIGDGDRSLMLDDYDAEKSTVDEVDAAVRAAVDAANTLALFTERRVVVLRHINVPKVDGLQPLVAYLASPVAATDIIFTATGAVAKSVLDAIKKAGGSTVATTVSQKPKERELWFREQLELAGLRLDPHAISAINETLGNDTGRFPGIVDTLLSTYGTGKKLSYDDVVIFLGESGSTAPWHLTDAIDTGNTGEALKVLHRLMHAGEMHPLQVMVLLHRHFERFARLDGAGVSSAADAMALLSIRSEFPARKAMQQADKLGSDAITQAIVLIADADVQLRGQRDWPEELVMEVLVARLSRLAGGARRNRAVSRQR